MDLHELGYELLKPIKFFKMEFTYIMLQVDFNLISNYFILNKEGVICTNANLVLESDFDS